MTSLLRSYVLLALILASVAFVATAADPDVEPPKDKLPAVLSKANPETVADLRAMQDQVKKVLKKAIPATVGIQLDGGSGSGVIINEKGLVLTAGHVSRDPGKNCILILPDGREIKGKTLGWNQRMDSGMIQITEKGPWPFVKQGDSSKVKRNNWVVAVGHPGGYKPTRSPVVRLGRVQKADENLIQTDCTLVGGDSGGPLFDMHGDLIGIHSRISWNLTDNIHVPINSFKEDWDRLAKGEKWGSIFDLFNKKTLPAYLGVGFDPDTDDLKVDEVRKDTAAEKAGVKVGDVIVSIDGKKVATRKELAAIMQKKKVGEEVTLEVTRGDKTLKLTAKLGKRPVEKE